MASPILVPDHRAATDPNDVIDPSRARDSTAGLQRFIDATPPGATIELPFDLQVNGTVTVHGDRTLQSAAGAAARLLAPVLFPWRVVPDPRPNSPGYNPKGICAPFLYDLGLGLANPYGLATTSGAEFGGYDGTTGASGVDYDGLHLSTRLSAPFQAEHQGLPVRVLAYDDGFNEIITQVAADGKTIRWVDRDHVAQHESTTHTVAWCVEPKRGWGVVFQPNRAWQPAWFFQPKNHPWNGYDDALQACNNNNRGRTTLVVKDTSKIIGVEVVGANPTWGQPVINYDASRPVVNEFQHGIRLDDPTAVAYLCHAHHVYGDGFAGPGKVLACRADHLGRHGMVGHYDDKLIDGCVIDTPHHAAIDFESPKPTHRVTVRNTAIGNHGISCNSVLIDCVFDGVHSTQADVDAGTIDSLSDLVRGPSHGAPGASNVTYRNGNFDKPTKNGLVAVNIDGLHVHNNKATLYESGEGSAYFVKPYRHPDDACTNVDVSGNDGGPKMKGQVAPVPKP